MNKLAIAISTILLSTTAYAGNDADVDQIGRAHV